MKMDGHLWQCRDCGSPYEIANCYKCSDYVCACTLMSFGEFRAKLNILEDKPISYYEGRVYVCQSCLPREVQG